MTVPEATNAAKIFRRFAAALAVGIVIAMALSASAWASEWTIEGKALTDLGEKEEVKGSAPSLLISVPAQKLTIECEKEESKGSIFEAAKGAITISPSNCKVPGNPGCTPLPFTITATLSVSGIYLILTGSGAEKLFTTIIFNPLKCAFSEENELIGTMAVEGEFGIELAKRSLVFSKKVAEAAKVETHFGVNTAFLEMTDTVSLTGVHTGQKWGLAATSTKLCKASTGACNSYALGTVVSAGLEEEVKFDFLYEGEELEPPCRVSSMKSTITAVGSPLLGEVNSLSFKECGGGLCTVTAQHLPYKTEFTATGSGNGTMTWSSGGSGQPAVAIKCLGLTKCIYGAKAMSFTVTGGTVPKLSNSGTALEKEAGSEEACGVSGAKWEGIAAAEGKVKYKVTAPNPLFVRVF